MKSEFAEFKEDTELEVTRKEIQEQKVKVEGI